MQDMKKYIQHFRNLDILLDSELLLEDGLGFRIKHKVTLRTLTHTEQIHSHVRCVPKTENPSRNKAGTSAVRTMEPAQSRLAASSLLSSASFIAPCRQPPATQRAALGERKLGTVITPDTWKDGARNTTESGGRKLNENKALTSKKARFDPYGKNKFAICRICKSSVHQPGSHYCQGCAYKKGICSMCGKKVLDTKNYKQTSV